MDLGLRLDLVGGVVVVIVVVSMLFVGREVGAVVRIHGMLNNNWMSFLK